MRDTPRILILEHDPYDIEMLQREILKSAPGAVLGQVQLETQFTKALLDFKPDIIFSDYSLPGFSGSHAFSITQSISPETPFIVVSGTVGEETAVNLIKQGITDFILKDKLFQVGPKMKRALDETRERKQRLYLEKKLALHERQLQKILDQSPDVIFTLDENGAFKHVGATSRKILGYMPDQLIGKRIYDFVSPERLELITSILEEARQGKEVLNKSYPYVRKDNQHLSLLLSMKWDEEERTMYCVAKDATDIRKTQESLLKSEDGLKRAQEISHIGNWEVDFATQTSTWSDELYRIYGLEVGEVEPSMEKWYAIIHADDLPMVKDLVAQSQITLKPNSFNHRIVRPDGSVRVCFSESRFVFGPQGAPTGIYGIVQDITEKTAQERALLNKSRMLEAIAEASHCLMKEGHWFHAMEESFEIIGQAVQADRVYYFENYSGADGKRFTSQKVEWCREGISKQLDNPFFQNLPLDLFSDYADSLSKNKIFLSHTSEIRNEAFRNMLLEQEVKSFIAIPVFLEGDFHGFVGFDDCTTEREWTNEEIGFLKTLVSRIEVGIGRAMVTLQLEREEENYRNLFNLSPLPMWIFDPKTLRFLNVNEAAIKHYGYSREEFAEKSLYDIRAKEDIPQLKEISKGIRAGDEHTRALVFHLKSTGERIQVDLQTSLIKYNGKPARLVLAIDVTERMEYVNAIEQQNKQLNDIAWMQSHVVRAPLARLMGLAGLLGTFKKGDHDINSDEILSNILESANELDQVVRDIVSKTENLSKPVVQDREE